MGRIFNRGELYYADLNPIVGSEQGGFRPVLIIQNNVGNYFSNTVIVAVISSHAKKNLPTHVEISADYGLKMKSIIMLEHIRTIDKSRIYTKIGKLKSAHLKTIEHSLKISLGLI